jgi:hypothetical protein
MISFNPIDSPQVSPRSAPNKLILRDPQASLGF